MSAAKSPPSATSGVFSVTVSTVIDAPRDKVWAIMLDFPSYKHWNSFVRGLVITDKSGSVLQHRTPAEGDYLRIAPVHIPPTMGKPGWFQEHSANERITVVDHENYRFALANIDSPFKFLGYAERWQILTVDSEGRTIYQSTEVFGGILAYLVKFLMHKNLILGFHAHADGLKRRAEEA